MKFATSHLRFSLSKVRRVPPQHPREGSPHGDLRLRYKLRINHHPHLEHFHYYIISHHVNHSVGMSYFTMPDQRTAEGLVQDPSRWQA